MRPKTADMALLRRWKLPDLTDAESKEDRGRILIVAGSREIPGAALLSAHASLRVGAGKLHVATSADVAPAVAIAMPEARVSGIAANARGEIARVSTGLISAAEQCDALLVGPGMAPSASTQRVAKVAPHARKPRSSMLARSLPRGRMQVSSLLTMARWHSCAAARRKMSRETLPPSLAGLRKSATSWSP